MITKNYTQEEFAKEAARLAAEKRLRPLETECVCADNLEYTDCYSPMPKTYLRHRMERSSIQGFAQDRLDQMGRFSGNHALIAVVKEDGHAYLLPALQENYKKLQEAGYENKPFDVYVPFTSPDEIPADKNILELISKWCKLHEKDCAEQRKLRGEN